jgi:16S rRNA C967 or C1407 C5-methylase (RsmB/RsmF family)/NOL1/NOP2/fmu family ribosome biogenesis protein
MIEFGNQTSHKPTPVSTSLPEAWLNRMRDLLGTEFSPFIDSYSQLARAGLRVNELKANIDEVGPLLPWELQPVPWCPSGFIIETDARPGKHPLHAAGLYYLQEPSAMAVVEALDVRPGHLVLDVAAAPGGKSTHIASKLQGEGVLVANDPIPGRIKALGENLERWGTPNAIIANSPIADLAAAWPHLFDRVLVDAPCSGEGMFRKLPVARQEWSEGHVQGCAVRQERLLNEAAAMVKPGGLLLYSTCTFAPEENEQQVCRFLNGHPGWELVNIPKAAGFSPGRAEGTGKRCPADVRRMARIWPHLAAGEGHAMALLQAPEDWAPDARHHMSRGSSRGGDDAPSREPLAAWEQFRAANVPTFEGAGTLLQRGDQLFLMPEGAPSFAGVRVVRPGLPLGLVRRDRFEPSHALALAVPVEDETRSVALNDDEAARYLRGEPVHAPGPPGWTLMTSQGFSFGWGKRTGDVVKNHYPKGLRSVVGR